MTRRDSPLVISFPHAGTAIPQSIARRMTPPALAVPDTDWHLPWLVYDFAAKMNASTIVAQYSRYVIDLNRPPDGASLYPGQATSDLCPVETFRGEPLYREGEAPQGNEIDERRARYWQPYHDALMRMIAEVRERHGYVIIWDAHSIASVLPRFFEGKLPDLNIGTADGKSCAPGIASAIGSVLGAQSQFTWVVNGRYKGGYITRHYGRPTERVHAVQLEMCQSTYMYETPPYAYHHDLLVKVQPVVRKLLEAVLQAERGPAPIQ